MLMRKQENTCQGMRKIQVSNILLFPERILKSQNIHLGTIYVHCPNIQ